MSSAIVDRGIEDAANVASFLNAIQPLEGSDYSSNLRFFRGHQWIRHYAAERLMAKDCPQLKITDAADVLYVMHNIQPVEGERIFDGNRIHCGYVLILTWVEQSLLSKGVRHG